MVNKNKTGCINCNNYKNLKLEGFDYLFNLCYNCLDKILKMEIKRKWDNALNNMSEKEKVKLEKLLKELKGGMKKDE